jgi:hypothetical protein
MLLRPKLVHATVAVAIWLSQSPSSHRVWNGQFVAAGNWDLDISRGTIQTSRVGLTWRPPQEIAGRQFRGVAFGNSRLVVVGDDGEILQSGPIIPFIGRSKRA